MTTTIHLVAKLGWPSEDVADTICGHEPRPPRAFLDAHNERRLRLWLQKITRKPVQVIGGEAMPTSRYCVSVVAPPSDGRRNSTSYQVEGWSLESTLAVAAAAIHTRYALGGPRVLDLDDVRRLLDLEMTGTQE